MGNSTSGRAFRLPGALQCSGRGSGPFSPPSPALGENKGRAAENPLNLSFPRASGAPEHLWLFTRCSHSPGFPFWVLLFCQAQLPGSTRVKTFHLSFRPRQPGIIQQNSLLVTSSTEMVFVTLSSSRGGRHRTSTSLRCSVQAGGTCGVFPFFTS